MINSLLKKFAEDNLPNYQVRRFPDSFVLCVYY